MKIKIFTRVVLKNKVCHALQMPSNSHWAKMRVVTF